MCGSRVWLLLALLVSSARSFSWDIVVGKDKQLEFYYNGTLTHTEVVASAHKITSVTYDPVHNRLLFADNDYPSMSQISSFDLSTREIQTLVTDRSYGLFLRIAYDPVTNTCVVLFAINDINYGPKTNVKRVSTISLNPASSNKTGKRLVTLDRSCWDLAVDSCGGYIYWITEKAIERARLDGSEKEVLIESTVDWRASLAIDQQTQKMYWIERINKDDQWSIESASLNGNNRTTLYIERNKAYPFSLTISKDFIYWQNYYTWQLPKNQISHTSKATKLLSMSNYDCVPCHCIATNYTIKEQIQGIKSCGALQALIPKSESTVSICDNYCFQGECSVSAEEQPICSCKAGYSGERCEVNACHDYCQHGGVCSLNEEDEPICECTADYEGERCNVAVTQTGDRADNTTQQVLRDLRSEVRQVIKEELKRILQFFTDKVDEYETTI